MPAREKSVIAWYFLWVIAAMYHQDVIGPFPTHAVCVVAREAAVEFGATGATKCLPADEIDAYLVELQTIEDAMALSGGPT